LYYNEAEDRRLTCKTDTVSSKTTTIDAKEIAVSGLFTAMVFIATMFLNIRLPISVNGGLIHLEMSYYLRYPCLRKRKGAVAGAFGMGLFDIVSDGSLGAVTFVIRGIMGYLAGSIANFRGQRRQKLCL
jgi:uncharacterized membrane protein